MMLSEEINTRIFSPGNDQDWNCLALEIFRYQAEENPVYRKFLTCLNVNPYIISHYTDIPFMPVGFFKDHVVVTGDSKSAEKIFTSSTTTGTVPSRHFICDLRLYEESFLKAFRLFYGDVANYRLLALLPGYLERTGSSLVYMLNFLIRMTERNGSGFFLHDHDALETRLLLPVEGTKKTILFGASYALLDFSERHPIDLSHAIIMETGGMKGRRREMVREELHLLLCRRFQSESIHSEYGMTELLSQAYSQGNGIYRAPPWMKVLVRDPNDPLTFLPAGKTGGINIIDLANIYSCSFIATQDLGRSLADGSFEILGRFDESEVRGCNLLVV